MEAEIWKDVVGYENLYEVSSLGNVRRGKGNGRLGLLKQSKSHYGYNVVKFLKKKQSFVHRLVALAFIPNSDNKPQVNHKDGIRTNNKVENLEWCTNQENIIHSFKELGRHSGRSKAIVVTNTSTGEKTHYSSQQEAANKSSISLYYIKRYMSGAKQSNNGCEWGFMPLQK